MKGLIRKADIVLAVVLTVLCIAASVAVYGFGKAGNKVTVKVEGKLYGEYDIGTDRVVEIDTKFGHNEITIEGGKVHMSNADCPDKYCMHQFEDVGGIHTSNQTIVCLPNKVVVSIESYAKEDDIPDAVSGRSLNIEE